MNDGKPSLYEMLLRGFRGGLCLHEVAEHDQLAVSILDNLSGVCNVRAGTLTHLPDLGLPDFSEVLDGVPGSAHDYLGKLRALVLACDPRVLEVDVRLLAGAPPGHLGYTLQVQLEGGGQATFATVAQPGGKLLLRHLKQHYAVAS